jgi:hypothetical protein
MPTGFIGFMGKTSVLRVSGYPFGTDSGRLNLDS